MKITKFQLNQIYQLVDKIKLNKISDTSLRHSLLKLIIEGKKNKEELEKDTNAIRSKFFDDFNDDDRNAFQEGLFEISKLLTEGKTSESLTKDKELSEKYPEITEAYKSYGIALNELQNECVLVDITPVDIEVFVDSMLGQDLVISGDQLEIFNPIFNNGSES